MNRQEVAVHFEYWDVGLDDWVERTLWVTYLGHASVAQTWDNPGEDDYAEPYGYWLETGDGKVVELDEVEPGLANLNLQMALVCLLQSGEVDDRCNEDWWQRAEW
jgi:hypothetical protein